MGLCWIRTEAQNLKEAVAGAKSAGNVSLLLQVPTVSAGVLLFLF